MCLKATVPFNLFARSGRKLATLIWSQRAGIADKIYFHDGNGFQVIAAEGEQKASRALREAAEVIAESPSALQVKLRKASGWKRKCYSWKVREAIL